MTPVAQRLMLVMRRLCAVLVVGGLLPADPARALDPARRIEQFHHTSWSLRDGIPSTVTTFAQTPDGFLWIGSQWGLHRFDGVRAERFGAGQLPSGPVLSLATSDDGDLWIGLEAAQIARVRRSEMTNFAVPTPGHPQIYYLAPDRDGAIWVGTRDSVLRFDGLRWQAIGSPWPPATTWSDPGGIWGLALARDGTVWAKNLLGLYYLRRGGEAFEQAPDYAGGVINFARTPDGRLWTADFASQRFYALPDLSPGQPIPQRELGAAAPPSILGSVRADREGTVWNANLITGGLYRVTSLTAPAAPERFTVPQGLSSDIVSTVFEDREGNIWIATSLGIERFRHANVVAEPGLLLRPQAAQLVATEEAVFLYSGMGAPVPDPSDAGRRLFRMRPGQAPELAAPDIGQVEAMAAAPGGDLVFAAGGKLQRWRSGVITPIAIPRDIEGGHVNNLVATADGGLWVSVYGKGVYRFTSGRWTHITPPSAPSADAPTLALDAAGAVWLFYDGDLTIRVEGEQTTELHSVSSQLGQIRATLADRDGLILVGDLGVARFDEGAFEFLPASRVPALGLCFGITATRDGDIWIGTQMGILRITRTALLKALAEPQAALDFRLFDASDGFTGAQNGDVHNNAMVAGPDGRIWFFKPIGVAWIDFKNLHRNPQPPPVVITSLTALGRRYDMPSSLALPAGASQLEIDYTALSLAAPERVRFRYKLTGVHTDWIEAGGRRQAFYTNVPPGEHRFQVIASNNDGVWNMTGATITFTIAPTFLQSIWFKFLIALALAGLAWLAYTMRLRQLAARLQNRFDVRIAERERIARELHDTLLQSIQGLILRFQSIANRVPADSDLRGPMHDAIDRADAVVAEGRNRVRELRTTTGDDDLAKAIVDIAHSAIPGEAPRFALTVEGAPRVLQVLVGEELPRIAEEAIRNSVQHANAETIRVVVSFGRSELRLTIRDDGAGMSSAILTGGEKQGHFGLMGMRERAKRMGGRLDITSREGAGTEITLTVTGRAAYRDLRARS